MVVVAIILVAVAVTTSSTIINGVLATVVGRLRPDAVGSVAAQLRHGVVLVVLL